MNNTIQEFFEQQVELTPNAIAIIFEEQKFTYSYINEKANQLEARSGTSPCDFYMELDEKDKQILGRVEYKSMIYSIEYIEEFITIFMDSIVLVDNQEIYKV